LSSQLNPPFSLLEWRQNQYRSRANAVTTLEIRSNQHHYEALVGSNLLDRVGKLIAAKISGPRCAIISDMNVARHFGDRVV